MRQPLAERFKESPYRQPMEKNKPNRRICPDSAEGTISPAADVRISTEPNRHDCGTIIVMKRLVRPKQGRKIAGVCLGVADYLNVDVTLVRLLWIFALLPGGIPGLVPYLLCWIIIPSE